MSSFVDEVIQGWKRGKISTARTPDEVLGTVLLSLHNTIRFNGLCRRDYNVLSHSWLVGAMSEDLARINGESDWNATMARFAGMTHDFGEAIVGDMVWPLKTGEFEEAYKNYEQLENAARNFIVEYALGVSCNELDKQLQYVKKADSFFGMLETLGASQIDDYLCFQYFKPLFDRAVDCGIGNVELFGEELQRLVKLLRQ